MEVAPRRSLMFWKKDKAAASESDIAIANASANNEFEGKDVGLFSLFVPFIKNYATSMSKTKNPARIPYPTVFYLPASSLMHMVHLQMSHIDLLIDASMQSLPVERFLGVLKYCISTWSLTKFPYKPIISLLGETAHYTSPYGSAMDPADKTYALAENVKKDVPVSCYYISNPTHGVTYQGVIELVPKFKQAHVHVQFLGQNKTTFVHPQGLFVEEYFSEIPDVIIRLLRMHQELLGEVNITSSTGFAAKISIKEKAIFGKAKNQIVGHITFNGMTLYSLDGAWDDVIYITDVVTGQRTPFFSRAALPKNPIIPDPAEQQPKTSCDRIWGNMLDALKREDFDSAAAIKTQIMHDAETLLYPETKDNYVPRNFAQMPDGSWRIKDPSLATGQMGNPGYPDYTSPNYTSPNYTSPSYTSGVGYTSQAPYAGQPQV